VNAIVDSHSEDSQVLAAQERSIPTATISSYTRAGFGPIICGEFGVVATEQLEQSMVVGLGDTRKTALMARHGAVAVSEELEDALFTAIVIEKAAIRAMKIISTGGVPEQLTLSHIFDEETARNIEEERVILHTQTVSVQRLG
jgi:L-fuculose-phosphate aldolase